MTTGFSRSMPGQFGSGLLFAAKFLRSRRYPFSRVARQNYCHHFYEFLPHNHHGAISEKVYKFMYIPRRDFCSWTT